jgi:hypothetical protein
VSDIARAPSRQVAALSLVILAALALYCATLFAPPSQINGDTSWLITVVEKLMGGARAYVDVIETNPPMAFLIYWPAVSAARSVGIDPESMVYLQTAAVAAVSMALSLHFARRLLRMSPGGVAVLATAIAVALLLAPSKSFTQREHLALMLLLPTTLSLAGRAIGAVPSLAIALAAGVLAGLGTTIKPHFVLVVALPAVGAALLRRDWRSLFAPEVVTAALLFLAYLAIWILVFGAFFDVPMFLVANSYRLAAYSVTDYFRDLPAVTFIYCCVIALVLTVSLRSHRAVVVTALAMLGFAVAFVEQSKGFAYHLYPVAAGALILMALAIAIGGPERDGLLPPPRALFFLFLAALGVGLSARESDRYPDSAGLRQAIVAVKHRPSLLIAGFDISANFPLARQVGGTWAGRLQSTWISNTAAQVLWRDVSPEQKARTLRAMEIEREIYAEDIARNRPELVVFDQEPTFRHLRMNERFRDAFDGKYRSIGTAQGGRFLLYRRIDP